MNYRGLTDCEQRRRVECFRSALLEMPLDLQLAFVHLQEKMACNLFGVKDNGLRLWYADAVLVALLEGGYLEGKHGSVS